MLVASLLEQRAIPRTDSRVAHILLSCWLPVVTTKRAPIGTTIAGVHELEKAGVRAAFINAVLAAATRADELASKL